METQTTNPPTAIGSECDQSAQQNPVNNHLQQALKNTRGKSSAGPDGYSNSGKEKFKGTRLWKIY